MDQRLFRRFDHPQAYDWTIEQIEEVASYLVKSAPANGPDPWPWAAHNAIRYLDARRSACLEAMASAKRESEMWERMVAEAPAIDKARAIHVEFEKGVRLIIGGKVKTADALRNYRKYLRHCPKSFDHHFGLGLCDDGELLRLRKDVDVYSRAPLLGKTLTREQAGAVKLHQGWDRLMFIQPWRLEDAEGAETHSETKNDAKILECYVDSYIEHYRKAGFTQWDVDTQHREYQEQKSEIIRSINRRNAKKRWVKPGRPGNREESSLTISANPK